MVVRRGAPDRRARALCAAVVALLLPAEAVAEGAPPPAEVPAPPLASGPMVAGLVAAVVLVAFLVNRFAPRKRRDIRRTAILLLCHLLAYGSALAFAALGLSWVRAAEFVTQLLADLTIINVVALALFDLALPAIRVLPATIVTDLSVGAAYLVAFVLTFRRSGVEVSSLFAGSAVVTGALVFSAQKSLENVIGGVLLQIDNTIRPGDWVQLESGRQGRVKEIRWRSTIIETRDWDTLVVPNSSFLSKDVLLLGKREGSPVQHRMWVYFNVDFRYHPADVIKAVEGALRVAPIENVSGDPPPDCLCMDFAKDTRDSFAYYAVRYWLTDLARDDGTSSRVRARVYAALKRANIPLAMPGAQLWIEQDSDERRERKHRREVERRLAALGGVEFLRALRKDELERIAEDLGYAPFAAGETITKQGAVAHWLYILTEGTAEIRVQVEGSEQTVATIEAPDFVGEMGLMTGEPRTATVVARTDVECYRLDKVTFNRVLKERPGSLAEVSSLLAHRRVELEAVKEGLDAAAKQRRVDDEKTRLLSKIRAFFALDDESRVA
jgi:small-conductance mechanosensitive channel/CRP-like cAMP-binding protein